MRYLEVNSVSVGSDGTYSLKDISFVQSENEKLAIAGETGSGKTSLLKTIAGLMHPDEGDVFFEGKRVDGPLDKLVPGHPQIAYLSQHFELPKFLRVEQVLTYANVLTSTASVLLLELCQIDHLLDRKTDQLSGGERQRIALARLLVGKPKLLLLDEPFSNLDGIHKETLKTVIANVESAYGITTLLVSHDPMDTLPWADRILILQDGMIIQQGSPNEIYHKPVDTYVAGLFGKFMLLKDEAIIAVKGNRQDNKMLFVRPEDLHFADETASSLKGIVSSIRFYGSYFEADVVSSSEVYTVRVPRLTIREGQEVNLQLQKDSHWFI